VHAHTHEFIATGQDDSKFGFNLANGDATRAVERARSSASVELVGLHCHIGSNVFAAASFAKAAEVMATFAAPLDLPELVLGGGLGVAYVEGEEAPTITEWGNVLLDACRRSACGRPSASSRVGRSSPRPR
jgi:diaminopimelate decarboxylase